MVGVDTQCQVAVTAPDHILVSGQVAHGLDILIIQALHGQGCPTQALILSGFSGMLGMTIAFPHIPPRKGPEHAY
jgi:hypothetical protein